MSKKIILKISGEFLAGRNSCGFDDNVLDQLTDDIIEVKKLGVALGIVLGGGNIYRGSAGSKQISRIDGDHIGMLATLQNSLIVSSFLNKRGFPAHVFSALQIDKVAAFYHIPDVIQALDNDIICFLACGTGNPYFTTDTTAVLRAVELQADLVLKGTKVDGVYCSDPIVNKQATFYPYISYEEALHKRLKVMDLTAFSLARENDLQIKVFNITKKGNVKEAITNPDLGTLVSNKIT